MKYSTFIFRTYSVIRSLRWRFGVMVTRWSQSAKILRVVNNTFQKYSPYQYIYFMKKVLAIPIPINELQKYAILSPILSAILFW